MFSLQYPMRQVGFSHKTLEEDLAGVHCSISYTSA